MLIKVNLQQKFVAQRLISALNEDDPLTAKETVSIPYLIVRAIRDLN